jgi:FKBP-type peptidyl-prolyl cis-trans isomerase
MRRPLIAVACCGLLIASVCGTLAAPQRHAPKPTKPKAAKAAKAGKWVTTKSGLKYKDITVGKGQMPKVTDTVRVTYTGTLKDGKVFDASSRHGGPIEFPLNRVIPAWTEGVSSMRVGGKRVLVAPPDLAYGSSGTPDGAVPPNATLTFEVELLGIRK